MEIKKKSVCIIGAGLTGLSAGYFLNQNKKLNIRILEAQDKIGGRSCTGFYQQCYYDYGANYFHFEESKQKNIIKSLIFETNFKEDLIEIKKPLWLFNGDGLIYSSDQQQGEKFNFKKGMQTLPNLLSQDLDIQYNTIVSTIERTNGQWQIFNNLNQLISISDYIVMTPVAPQALTIMQKSNFIKANSQKLLENLKLVQFYPQICVVLAFQNIISKQYFALLNLDRQHDIIWLNFEHEKQGHVKDNLSMVVVQLSRQWSAANYQKSEEVIAQIALDKLVKLIDINLNQNPFIFSKVHKFEYALPGGKIEINNNLQKDGFILAGDYIKGKGRVDLALESGYDAAQQIIQNEPKM